MKQQFTWAPATNPSLRAGDNLVVADFDWFGALKGNTSLPVERPKPDDMSAPKPTCTSESYASDPVSHQYCCRPHEDARGDLVRHPR